MTAHRELAQRRLRHQRLHGPALPSPAEVVGWLGAVQSQDYNAAKWALALRTTGATNEAIDRLFDEGAIIRTHVMRPTWHFVLPADLRWLLALTAPRVHIANRGPYRELELDDDVLLRCRRTLERVLQGGNALTRDELEAALQADGIELTKRRLVHITMYFELEALICSGPRRGKQHTYVLVEERVPPAPVLGRDEALAELTRRYYASHGPATPHDFAWWSGLTVSDARRGIELNGGRLASEQFGDQRYWFDPSTTTEQAAQPLVHLLPNFDEHVVAYRDHAPSVDPAVITALPPNELLFKPHPIARDGLVIGTWRSAVAKRGAKITANLLIPADDTLQAGLHAAAEAYGAYIGLPTSVVIEAA
ncbi:MAG TPA: winged helix DNA-binding domain-containing protein [Thermomicrobiales bacterium]